MNIILMYVPFCLAFQNVLQEIAHKPFRMNIIDNVYNMYDVLYVGKETLREN